MLRNNVQGEFLKVMKDVNLQIQEVWRNIIPRSSKVKLKRQGKCPNASQEIPQVIYKGIRARLRGVS